MDIINKIRPSVKRELGIRNENIGKNGKFPVPFSMKR
jgi:hypothetical protein